MSYSPTWEGKRFASLSLSMTTLEIKAEDGGRIEVQLTDLYGIPCQSTDIWIGEVIGEPSFLIELDEKGWASFDVDGSGLVDVCFRPAASLGCPVHIKLELPEKAKPAPKPKPTRKRKSSASK